MNATLHPSDGKIPGAPFPEPQVSDNEAVARILQTQRQDLGSVLVRDQMERELLTVSPTESCERALALMEAAGVDSLPVTEGARLVGMVSELDIRRRAPQTESHASASALFPYVRVMGVMTYAPPTCGCATDLAEAAALMLDKGLTALPVVESERLVGMLTTRSVLATLRGLLGNAGKNGSNRAERR